MHTPLEQLQLFTRPDRLPSLLDRNGHRQQAFSQRERLATLLAGELDFHGEDSGYASHDIHSFAAKFPPQLPRLFIRELTTPGDIVLDPMMGSGTTVVEALLAGRQGMGFDIDLLALRLSRVKTVSLDVHNLQQVGCEIITQAKKLLADTARLEREFASRFDQPTRAFLDYWFLPATQGELLALVMAIQEVADRATRRFFELTFSSTIVTKSGGVSLARDLAHSRPHLDTTKVPKNAFAVFTFRLRKNLKSLAHLNLNESTATTLSADARMMPLADESIDLIMTSPPYANAIDYMRAHKFSLVWLGASVTDLSDLRAAYIGSERLRDAVYAALPKNSTTLLRRLKEQDSQKAAILHKYLSEMQAVTAEMFRVLRGNATAVVVVGTSVMRGINVQTHTCLAEIAAEVGFEVMGVVQRKLDRNRRMMPASFRRKAGSMIEQRMHEEYVMGLFKA